MEGDKTFDFDLAFDGLYDFFGEEPTTEPPTNELSEEDLQECATIKKVKFRVMKNDIRRYYAQMFMNTVNSGDFDKLQGFFSTFMMGPGKFVCNHDGFDAELHLPPLLTAEGPKLAVHFHLGMFVMYPDTVIRMTTTRITTSNTWTGTKIEIGVNVLGTKIYDLSDDEWIPQLEILNEKCNKLAEMKRNIIKYDCPEMSSTDSSTGSTSSTCSGGSGGTVDINDASSDSAQNDNCSTEENDDNNKDEGRPANKRRRGRANAPSTRADQSHGNNNYISEDYVRALCAQATLLSKPIQFNATGVVSIFLDENNHIQHMNIRTRPA